MKRQDQQEHAASDRLLDSTETVHGFQQTKDPSLLGRGHMLALGLGLGGSLLRAMAAPPLVGDVDSVNFARALVEYDPLHQSPHLPGYPVFIAAARLVREAGVLSDVWALVLPGLIGWPLAAVILYDGARRWLAHDDEVDGPGALQEAAEGGVGIRGAERLFQLAVAKRLVGAGGQIENLAVLAHLER